ncbi:trypsin-like peptidase domain-containing protein [Luteolibacter soli]|uniref:Trypsin-like peptidase domain-containing protein n=1 Tax=Luteolibacter soli TaxID=3135280 RepID=A0ABU9AV78_9BACT
MISSRPFIWLAGPALACTGLVSCDRTTRADVAAAELKLSDKETEIEDLKSKVGKLEAQVQEAKKGSEKVEATLQQLKDSHKENETLKDEAEELRKENEKLKDQITAKIRARAIGEKHEQVAAPNGKVYRQVVIRKVDEEGVSIAHEGGVSTLNEDSAPATWVERFRLGVRKPEPPPPGDAGETAVAAAPPKGDNKNDKQAVVRAKLPGVLFVEDEKSKGSAFLATRDGTTWLYTAAHVLTQGTGLTVRNSDGARLTEFGKCEIASDRDLARIEVSVKPGLALTFAKQGGAKVGLDITAVGNSAGSDVLTLLNGRINALGPKEIEVTSSVIAGNSGGPVMLSETGEVVGVVCRAEVGRSDVCRRTPTSQRSAASPHASTARSLGVKPPWKVCARKPAGSPPSIPAPSWSSLWPRSSRARMDCGWTCKSAAARGRPSCRSSCSTGTSPPCNVWSR